MAGYISFPNAKKLIFLLKSHLISNTLLAQIISQSRPSLLCLRHDPIPRSIWQSQYVDGMRELGLSRSAIRLFVTVLKYYCVVTLILSCVVGSLRTSTIGYYNNDKSKWFTSDVMTFHVFVINLAISVHLLVICRTLISIGIYVNYRLKFWSFDLNCRVMVLLFLA